MPVSPWFRMPSVQVGAGAGIWQLPLHVSLGPDVSHASLQVGFVMIVPEQSPFGPSTTPSPQTGVMMHCVQRGVFSSHSSVPSTMPLPQGLMQPLASQSTVTLFDAVDAPIVAVTVSVFGPPD